MQAHGIVQAGFDVAGPVRRCPVKIGDTDRDRLHAALEVRSYRSGQDPELVLIRRLYADYGIAAEHVRTDIERRAASIRSNPGFICLDGPADRVHPPVDRIDRHLQSLAGILHALRIQVRPERHDMAVLGCVRLQAFKAGLGILENTGALIDHNVFIRNQGTFIPCAVLVAGYKSVICLHISKSER